MQSDPASTRLVTDWLNQHATQIVHQWLEQHAADIGAQIQQKQQKQQQQQQQVEATGAHPPTPPPSALRSPTPLPPPLPLTQPTEADMAQAQAHVQALRSPTLRMQMAAGGGGGGRGSPSASSASSTPSPVASGPRPLGLRGAGRTNFERDAFGFGGAAGAGGKVPERFPQQRLKGPLAEVRHQSAMPPGEEPAAAAAAREAAAGSASPPTSSASAASRRHSGSGLGLGAMGGSSSVASGGVGAASSLLQTPSADVLLVEDVRVAQRLACAMLSLAHYRVEVAESGEVALDKYRALVAQTNPQLRVVLMDIWLPGMDGVEATERIRAMEAEAAAQAEAAGVPPAAPVWIYGLTATVDPADLARYERAGMNGCILKGKVLADCVRRAVEESERNPRAFINMAAKFHDAPSSPSSVSGASPKTGGSGVRVPQTMPMRLRHVQTAGDVSGSESSTGVTTPVPMQVSAPGSPAPATPRSASPLVAGGGAVLSTPDFNMLRMASSPSPVLLPGLAAPTRSPPPPNQQSGLAPKRLGTEGGNNNGGNGGGNGNGSQYSGTKRTLSAMHDNGTASAVPAPTPPVAAATGSTATPAPWASPVRQSSSTTGALGSQAASTGGFDVLLVEDVRVAQRIAARALSAANYRVDVASSGEAAIERFRASAPTLRIVLMDINLPGMSGIDATEIIRRIEADAAEAARAAGETPRPPVVVLGLTGNVDEVNLRLYESAGMDGCIAKGRQLGDAVKQALRMHRAHPDLFVDLSGGHSAAAPAPAASPIPVPCDDSAADPTAAAQHVVAAHCPPSPCAAASAPVCPCGSPRGIDCPCPVDCVCASVCHATKRARLNPAESKFAAPPVAESKSNIDPARMG